MENPKFKDILSYIASSSLSHKRKKEGKKKKGRKREWKKGRKERKEEGETLYEKLLTLQILEAERREVWKERIVWS